MRRLAPALLLLATAACSRGLTKSDAEAALRAKYPVSVPVKVPGRVTAAAGSPIALRAQAFMDNLQKTGWFDITKTDGKTGELVYTFTAKAGAPVQASGNSWLVPAAQAVFVQGTHHEERGNAAKATYQIKLANPTAQFPLYELEHPAVHLGDTKLRHATFEKQGGAWVLTGTDETLTKGD
ncbi:MAG TPA: hypothetical protein VL181_00065 [Holophagaceae bacterium]|nr:hypothetical protein [Holophagaceae bacterium]